MRKARTAKGWTLEVLAHEALGNLERKSYVSRVEHGKQRLSAMTIRNFARVLDLPDGIVDTAMANAGKSEVTDNKAESDADALSSDVEALRQELKLSESLVVALAWEFAEGNPTDRDTAVRELRRALEIAAEERERGRLPVNTDDAVNAVITRVDALNDEGEIDAAAALIADEEARVEAGLVRLHDKGIAQAILTRDAETACAYELKKLAIEVPDPTAQFAALRSVWRGWYVRGRDKGLNFDLDVAIALARAALSRAADADQRGAAGIDLGNALRILGERETGTVRLEEAVAAIRAALTEYTHDRVPLDWAMVQNNLGNALAALGERETGTARLEEAVAAFRAALTERTRERMPRGWATIQNNLGNAFLILGERETGTAWLEEAVAAYRDALTERTRAHVPRGWAMTQNNLGNAFLRLGERETGTARLQEAVAAYRAALTEQTRDRVPLLWAGTTYILAYTEALIAERTSAPARAQEALDAARTAEQVLRDGGHADWASSAKTAIGEIEAIIARLSDD